MLIYVMGREEEDDLASLRLRDAQKQDYDAGTRAFTTHFVSRTNAIYKRVKFNKRKQAAHQTVDTIVTDLYKLAACEYGSLKGELIRDHLVIGLIDINLSEKLQLNAELALERAILTARNSETVKLQQKELRPQSQLDIGAVKVRGSVHRVKPKRRPLRGSPNQRDVTGNS
ncbi:hypothetical protein V5799_010403 [Amblyomma americanum]|uniref:Uncharacterized protein n=1 Tax=Amblyomma americanum TaxID=6943 RepID=A0AAQ4EK22_AMBAM